MRHFEYVASRELHCNLVVGRRVAFKTPGISRLSLALKCTFDKSSKLTPSHRSILVKGIRRRSKEVPVRSCELNGKLGVIIHDDHGAL